MKATKDEIIAIGKQLVAEIYRSEIIPETIEVEEDKVDVYVNSQDFYYEHNGWVFMAKDKKLPDDTFMIFLLDSGIPSYLKLAPGECASTPTIYAIKNNEGKFVRVSKEEYIKHQKFDFSQGFTKKEFGFW